MQRFLTLILVLPWAVPAYGDDLALANGETYTGSFAGFKNHRFIFKTVDGAERAEFASAVKSIQTDKPQLINARTLNGQLNEVLFKRYEKFNMVLLKDGREFNQPATLLKEVGILSAAPETVESSAVEAFIPADNKPASAAAAPSTARQISGGARWRMTQASSAKVISEGATVDLDKAIHKGAVNIVHFHFTQSLTSTREGNYVEALARKAPGSLVLLRVVISDWNAPICKDLGLTSLPQFWFYSRSGKPAVKLTTRFTESDIDDALSKARREN